MYPIAKGVIQADSEISPYSVLFALMFGASSSMVTPIGWFSFVFVCIGYLVLCVYSLCKHLFPPLSRVGYQTNLMVHSLGGYRFTDWLKMGGVLQLFLATYATLFLRLTE